MYCRAAAIVISKDCFTFFPNELLCDVGIKQQQQQKEFKAANHTTVPLLSGEIILSKINIFLPSLWFQKREGVCGG